MPTDGIWTAKDYPAPSYEQVLIYARRAVAEEYHNPHHGRFAGYQTNAVLDDVVNHWPGPNNGPFNPYGRFETTGKCLDVDRDEQLIRDAVSEAEQEFEEKFNVAL